MANLVKDLKNGLRDMKLKKNKLEEMEVKPESVEYPYSLSITLGNDQLKELGVKAEDFKIKDETMLLAEASVKRVSINQTAVGDRSEVTLQIRKLLLVGDE